MWYTCGVKQAAKREYSTMGIKPNTRYDVEPDGMGGSSWGDMSATEMEALAQWMGEHGPSLTSKDLSYYTQLAKSFKWSSRARTEILDGVAACKKKYDL